MSNNPCFVAAYNIMRYNSINVNKNAQLIHLYLSVPIWASNMISSCVLMKLQYTCMAMHLRVRLWDIDIIGTKHNPSVTIQGQYRMGLSGILGFEDYNFDMNHFRSTYPNCTMLQGLGI